MEILSKNGKFVQVTEQEIDIVQEEYKLQAWKDARTNDAREYNEWQTKRNEIESFDIPEEYKEILRQNTILHSGSGITQKMVDEQQAKVDSLK